MTSLPPKLFGCTVFVHNHSPTKSKLDPKAIKCVFIGYSPTQRGYKCYSPNLHRVFVSMDVSFIESTSFFSNTSLQGERLSEENSWDTTQLIENQNQLGDKTQKNHYTLPVVPTDYTLPVVPTETPENQSSSLPSSLPSVPNTISSEESRRDTTQSGGDQLLVYTRRNQRQFQGQSDLNSSSQESAEPIDQTLQNDVHSDYQLTDQNLQTADDPDQNLNWPIALRKGTRSCTQHPISKFVSYARLSSKFHAFTTAISKTSIPRNIKEALADPDWKAAVQEEIDALRRNKTWEMVTLPAGKKTVGCKWVFTIKYNADGSINRYKSRLVARGFTQTYGIDYQETFAPVAKLNTIRVLLSLAANLGWHLQQLDVKNAFLNGDLHEEVYMEAPPGFEEGNNKVCKLRKSLYGLKQSPREWFDKFTQAVKRKKFSQAQTDHTLFYKHSQEGKIAILIVYVDDIIITGDDVEELRSLKKYLAEQFDLKDLGTLRYFLGMEVAYSSAGITINQRKYVLDLLQEVGMLGCKPAETPMDSNNKLGMEGGEEVSKEGYQKLVGKLIYLSHTRPDIAFAVSVVSQFMHSPKRLHMEAVIRILRYLKNTPGRGLFFKKGDQRMVEVYTDADWAGSAVDRRSTSGYCTYLWGNLVTWRSKKQPVVARSSAEAEFRALAHGICEGIWLQRLLKELRMINHYSMKIYCDNQAAVSIAQNPVHHDRTKHVEVDRHFIKDKIDDGVVSLNYIPTKEQTADVLTKSLHKPSFENLVGKLGMINIYSQLEGECR